MRRSTPDDRNLALDAASMRKAHEIYDDDKDVATASLLETYIDEAERRAWFLFEAARSGDETAH